ncbi:OadG family protein [Brachyspira hyodysenteriae]|nr:OadG family protein [Brachyspira hyodysenteriae]MCZ9894044.1 OadG family protein [Brachyspira hyodysenteriae]
MNSSIIEALQIMLIGMGVVVLFLIILVFVMKFVAGIGGQADKLMPPPKEEKYLLLHQLYHQAMIKW